MGELIELSKYRGRRAKAAEADLVDGYTLRAEPPFMVVSHFRNGAFIGEERVLSEAMLKELLDRMPQCSSTPYSVHRSSRHSGGFSAGIHGKGPYVGLMSAGMTSDETDILIFEVELSPRLSLRVRRNWLQPDCVLSRP